MRQRVRSDRKWCLRQAQAPPAMPQPQAPPSQQGMRLMHCALHAVLNPTPSTLLRSDSHCVSVTECVGG